MPNTDVLLSGAFAALTVDLLVYPLDTLKTRLQSRTHRQLPKLRGLYQGLGPVILATLPSAGIFFSTYEFARSRLPSHALSDSAASALAEVCSCAILTPAEVIKQNAQVVEQPGGSASLRALRNIRRPRDLWTGYAALVARNLPYTALQFPMFELLKRRLVSKRAGVVETTVWAGVAAGSAGAVAAVVTTPVDVVKTRIMLSVGHKRSVKEVVGEVLSEEGVRGLFRGGALRAVWTMFGAGLYLGVYEGCKVWFGNGRKDQAVA
ncbi:mitochondrial carrier protein-like protein [Sphaerosporella brunnea]|uniref:Mitochondrial carrier protein-like protein n=1 Tax=Sphaerosporella brunnea TaxID=1250544 RepID=A0A5J5EN59_9PEZI|nr:mitochondrial carrier protein-like protein [Sphaerosporella brunnea]